MSHIVQFEIEGLAGRSKPLEIKLNRDDNVFFGQTGSGKTSILKILHSAMSNDVSALKTVPFTSASVTIYSVSYDTEITRKVTKE